MIRTARSLRRRLEVLWVGGMVPGDSTGWKSVDAHYTVAPGLVTVITGWPGSGKSEWLDAMLMHLRPRGWHIVYYSPENLPVEVHLSKLAEKVTGKPFGRGPNERMSAKEVDAVAEELGDAVAFIEPGDEALHLGEIIEDAEHMFAQLPADAKRALVIDPWNELKHPIGAGETETKYISEALGYVRRWARATGVHVFIVAHPAKQPRENGKLPVPKPDMIAGSQHWWNKADQCITVWRDMSDTQEVQVHVQKVRFKHHGRVGMVTLTYDRVTGRYHEPLRDAEGRVYEFSYGRTA